MATVTQSRVLGAPAETIKELILADVPAFIRASGFDSVEVIDDQYIVSQSIGFATLELELVERESEQVLTLEQTDGIFDEMWTEYTVEPRDPDSGSGDTKGEDDRAESEITARTEFTLGGVLGPVLDETMITSRRTEEFEQQFDYLEERIAVEI